MNGKSCTVPVLNFIVKNEGNTIEMLSEWSGENERYDRHGTGRVETVLDLGKFRFERRRADGNSSMNS